MLDLLLTLPVAPRIPLHKSHVVQVLDSERIGRRVVGS